MEVIKNLYEKWCKIPDKIRFLFIGGVNATISYIIFAIALYILGDKNYQACVILQWTISSVFSYFNQKFFVFCTKGNYLKEYLKCCTTWFFSYLINAGLLEFIVKILHLNVFVAQIIATITAAVFTYIFFKKFAFKKK